MPVLRIDGDLAVKHLVQLAEEKPDFVYGSYYPECLYFEETVEGKRPLCIVGHVFDRLGVLDQMSEEVNGMGLGSIIEIGLLEFTGEHGDEARKLLREAQASQDSDHTWEDSVRRAMEHYGKPFRD